MNQIKLCCPCLFGLESVLNYEVKKIGGENIEVNDGKVIFTGDIDIMARANICLRTAERVLIVVGTFSAISFTQLFDRTTRLPFEEFIGKNDAFPVKGWSLNSQLHSVPDCQSIIKKAVAKRMESMYHQSWFEESGAVHQIQFSIHKDDVMIMLDTTGPGLHKRGYRQNANEAPIKETLAAGIVDLARVRPDTQLVDPMCGSGTFLIEGALHGLNIAPGIHRKFAAESWHVFGEKIWKQERENAMEKINRSAIFRATGYDLDKSAVDLTNDNAFKAGVGMRVRADYQNLKDFETTDEPMTVICNPPYGERLLELEQAEEIYKTMGKVFKEGPGKSYYIISPHEDFERLFGRPARKRRKLYNGMIKCQLFMYF